MAQRKGNEVEEVARALRHVKPMLVIVASAGNLDGELLLFHVNLIPARGAIAITTYLIYRLFKGNRRNKLCSGGKLVG